ncbi:serine/threonine-protein kinase [Streptomyces sp. BI20]|uniref:serine/threonine-protein kinase n=1 Tax=Streptomyces sp. BI20 TaxID=3403460 RepID=UPI003C778608
MNTWTVPGYTETRTLGSGGSGRVVLAVHTATGVPVAVKYLAEDLRTDPAFVREFRAEARLLGALRSPWVVRLFEYVEGPHGAAIVMELVDGPALRALLRARGDGPGEPEAALALLKGSLLGLAAAHHAGVVHRDYKPENVLVTADGSSRLVDFGIAARRGDTPGVAGTPAYMAPEQWQGAPATPAGDVYAATATFFEFLTGHKPYAGENFAELAVRHVEAPIPAEEVPEAVRPLVLRGLAKHPGDRPPDAESFVAELETVAVGAYGPHWEERGQRKLAALAALAPLLFPSAGEPPAGTTALASTELPPAADPGSGWAPGRSGWVAAAAAAVAGALLVLATQAAAGQTGDRPGTLDDLAATVLSPTAPPSPTATLATPPSSSPPSPTPTQTPTPTPSHTPSPTASPTSRPPTPSASAGTRPGTPPSPSPSRSARPTTRPSPSGSPSPSRAPVVVRDVAVSLRQVSGTTGEVTITITADGAGPVTGTVEWLAGRTGTTPDGTDGFTAQAGARSLAPITLGHTFTYSPTCRWAVRVTTNPPSADGPVVRTLTADCTGGEA